MVSQAQTKEAGNLQLEAEGSPVSALPTHRHITVVFVALGILLLFPWNCFLSATDFFNQAFPGYNWSLYCTQVYQTVFLVIQLGMIFFGSNLGLRTQYLLPLGCCCLSTVAVMVIALSPGSESMRFALSLVFTALMGASMGVIQSSVFGVAAQGIDRFGNLPGHVMVGMGVAGIVAMALALGSQALFSSASYAFSVLFVAILLFSILGVSQYRLVERIAALSKVPATLAVPELSQSFCDNQVEEVAGDNQVDEVWGTCRSVRAGAAYELAIFFVFAVTFMIFPATAAQWKGEGGLPNDWYITVVMGMFQVMDTLGRYLAENCKPMRILGPAPRLWVFVILRLVFVPLFYMCKGDGSGTFHSQWFQLALMATMALTNGLFGSLAMQFAPQSVPAAARQTVGMTMSLFLVGGIVAGSYLAMVPLG